MPLRSRNQILLTNRETVPIHVGLPRTAIGEFEEDASNFTLFGFSGFMEFIVHLNDVQRLNKKGGSACGLPLDYASER